MITYAIVITFILGLTFGGLGLFGAMLWSAGRDMKASEKEFDKNVDSALKIVANPVLN